MNKALIRAAEKQGWQIEVAGKHVRWICPACDRFVLGPHTASDYRGEQNFIARLRRHGFAWKGRERTHAK